MTDTTPHRATAKQWADAEYYGHPLREPQPCSEYACILELRARVEALEGSYETMRLAALEWGKDVDKLMRWSDQHLHRIMALEAGATCPHIVSSDEGTSYCGLAEQQAAAAPPEPAPAGSLGGPLPPGVTWWGGRKGVEQFTEPAPAEQRADAKESSASELAPGEQQSDHWFPHVRKMPPAGSLVEKVHVAMANTLFPQGTDEARAAIRAVEEWMREHHADGDPVAATALEQEAER